MNALVIDDDPQLRTFVSQVLQEEGWQVTEAESAEQAFEMLRERDWKVVFCDVMLGGVDGYSVLRRFKEELPQTKVILMTGHGSAVGALDATAYGAYDYLLKPFGVDALQSLSRAVAERLAKIPHHRLISTKTPGAYETDIDLVGRSDVFIEVMKQVGRVAGTSLPVLLTGNRARAKRS